MDKLQEYTGANSTTIYASGLIIIFGLIILAVYLYKRYNRYNLESYNTEPFYAPATDEEADVTQTKKLMLFYSPECPHCTNLMNSDNWKSIQGKIPIEEINTQTDQTTPNRYNISTIPTILLVSGDHTAKYDQSQSLSEFINGF